jgi:tetratricopeptide (TPR) repeat protein
VLRLLDLPLADDMPGAPVEEALTAEFLDAHPARRRTTYEGESTTAPGAPSLPPAAQEEMLARLRSLGYLAPEAGGGPVPGGGTMSANYHTNLASIFAGRGERERARQEFERALELLPDHPGAVGGLVQLDLNEGKLEDALQSARRLLQRQGPGLNPVFYFLTAYLFVETGRADDGLKFYDDLARERPQVSQVFTGLGVLLQARGDVPGALAAYRKALDGKPDALYALQELYTLEAGGPRLAQVLAYCARAIEAAPQEVLPYNWQGLTLRQLGRVEQAEASFRKALDVSPDSLRTQVNLSSLLVDGGRAEEALPLLRRVVEQQGTPMEARVNLVVALGRTGRLAEAEEVFQAGEPQGTDLLNAMAFACYLNQAPERARELLERSLVLDPEQPEARRLLAQLG